MAKLLSPDFYLHPLVWLAVTLVSLWLCTYLPLMIQDNRLRTQVNRFVLIPVSILLILYTYPVGIECFRKIAVNWQ